MNKRANVSPITGASIIQAFKDADIRTVVALPDIVTCETVLWPISSDSSFQFVPVCKEDEGVSICAGLSYCEHRAVLLMQHTGFWTRSMQFGQSRWNTSCRLSWWSDYRAWKQESQCTNPLVSVFACCSRHVTQWD